MIINNKNQNDIISSELINSYDIEFVFNNKPKNRFQTKPGIENRPSMLERLRENISNIENCELKKNASKLVFSDGSHSSPIMIVGEGPGQKEDQEGKPFVGDAGLLLNKMLKSINIERKSVYITNVVNYRPPENRKPEPSEISRYANYLKQHISIIDPKILILMGSTAMEAVSGLNGKISDERGKWKEIILKNKTFPLMITFSPSYLIRYPENKKYSWEDLKKIKQKIQNLDIKI